ncbi:uncharacterized protein UTRI_04546_B [Ustilago trichophora]|uniref:Secreted protein n=1 Tax=Ustilago trichophora TaxID=86804 RepID=A0A5C3ED65_9BASI|nr:uncharacterized protein UTRI_04546_B [Ustilago trichophora]
MLDKKGATAMWIQVAILLLLACSALGSGQLESVPEHVEMFNKPSTPAITGPADGDLYPVPASGDLYPVPATYLPAPRVHNERVPVTGLVRVQGKVLRPYHLGKAIYRFNFLVEDTEPRQESERSQDREHRRFRFWQTDPVGPDAPPANKKQLEQLLSEIPRPAPTFDKELRPDRSTLGKQFNAVKLKGKDLDRETLKNMMAMQKPFFVQGAGGKVWYFHTEDGNHFTYTHKVKESDKRSVRKYLHSVPPNRPLFESADASAEVPTGAPVDTPSGTPAGTPPDSPDRFFGSPAPFGQMERSHSRYSPGWARKLSEGIRSIFRKPAAFIGSTHAI